MSAVYRLLAELEKRSQEAPVPLTAPTVDRLLQQSRQADSLQRKVDHQREYLNQALGTVEPATRGALGVQQTAQQVAGGMTPRAEVAQLPQKPSSKKAALLKKSQQMSETPIHRTPEGDPKVSQKEAVQQWRHRKYAYDFVSQFLRSPIEKTSLEIEGAPLARMLAKQSATLGELSDATELKKSTLPQPHPRKGLSLPGMKGPQPRLPAAPKSIQKSQDSISLT